MSDTATTPGGDRGRELAALADAVRAVGVEVIAGKPCNLAELGRIEYHLRALAAPAETEAGDECPNCGATDPREPRGGDCPDTWHLAATPPAPEGEAGSVDGALAWVERAAWDTPTVEQRADEARIPHELIDVVGRVLRRKYRAIAARLVAERWPHPSPPAPGGGQGATEGGLPVALTPCARCGHLYSRHLAHGAGCMATECVCPDYTAPAPAGPQAEGAGETR